MAKAVIVKHIASQFDNDLEAIQAHTLKMGGLVEMAILDPIKAFFKKRQNLCIASDVGMPQ